MDEPELVVRARQGDQGAYTTLVERHRADVYRLAYRNLLNAEDARDVAQEAFIQAYLNLDQLRDPARFGPWLKQITINECRMWLRRVREIEPQCASPETVKESEQVDLRLAVQHALSCLSPESRRTIVLYYVHSYSLMEIANQLEVPVTTIKSRLRDARARLRKEMGEMHEEKSDKIVLPMPCRRLFDEVFGQGKLAVAEEIVSPGFGWHHTEMPLPPGPEAVKQMAAGARSAFPDLRFEIEECIESGDKVVVRWILRGTHRGEFSGLPATGLAVTSPGISIFRLEKGKLAELWQQFDERGIYRQLGFTPPRPPHDPDNPELPLNRMLGSIMTCAINDGATEIRIEPRPIDETVEFDVDGKVFHTQQAGESVASILYRVDGLINEQMQIPLFALEGLAERIKTPGRIELLALSGAQIKIEYGCIRITSEAGEHVWNVKISQTEPGEQIILRRK